MMTIILDVGTLGHILLTDGSPIKAKEPSVSMSKGFLFFHNLSDRLGELSFSFLISVLPAMMSER